MCLMKCLECRFKNAYFSEEVFGIINGISQPNLNFQFKLKSIFKTAGYENDTLTIQPIYAKGKVHKNNGELIN